MNLEECEWNDIFTIEEQEIHNNNAISSVCPLMTPDIPVTPVTNSFLTNDKTPDLSELDNCLPRLVLDISSADQLMFAALHSDCKVLLEKLSSKTIKCILKNNTEEISPDKVEAKKTPICQNSNVNKLKKGPNNVCGGETGKSQNSSDQKYNTNPPTKTLSTINKNSVSRIVDAISIDSDDNQSCIIVSPVPNKPDNKANTDKAQSVVKIKSKLVKSILSDRKDEKSNIALGPKSSKLKHLKFKKDQKNKKKDWVDKNVRETPVSFDSFFNKKFSILGSGLKISKKSISPDAVTNNKTEYFNEDEQWPDKKKENTEFSGASALMDNDDDDYDDDDCQWPKAKDPYDPFSNSTKVKDGNNDDTGGGDDDDDDEGWPKENDLDENGRKMKSETNDKSQGRTELDDDECRSAQKWYDGDGEPGEDGGSANQANDGKKDPWSNYLSNKKKRRKTSVKTELVDDTGATRSKDDIIEITDDSDDGGAVDAVVKEESGRQTPPKKSLGNVWSHIQEFQSQLEKNATENNYIDDMNDISQDDVDDTLKTMNYIKDAKWLNSRNEDFLDSYQPKNSYCENMDSSVLGQNEKWFNEDKRDRSPRFHNAPDKHNNRGKNQDFMNNEAFISPESWVDSGPYKTYNKNSYNNNRGRHQPVNANDPRSKYNAPNNALQSPFKNMTMEQLFPPFKKEYFNNNNCSNNNFNQSQDPSANWQQNPTGPLNYPYQNYPKFPQGYHNKQPGIDQYQDGKAKAYPYDAHQNYDAMNGSYHNGYPMAGGDPYGMMDTSNPYSKMGGFGYYQNNAIPITPESPDQSTEEPGVGRKSKQNPDDSQTPLRQNHYNKVCQFVNGQNVPANQQADYLTYPQGDPNAYYYPYFGPPFDPSNPYPYPHPYYSYFACDPVSYTPASPDPEETCPPESANQAVARPVP